MNYYELLSKFPNLIGDNDALIKIVQEPDAIKDWQEQRQKELASKNLPQNWADIGVVFHDPYFFVVRDLVQFPNGRLNGYCRVLSEANLSGGHGAVVLPEYEGKVMLLHQYRHPTRKWHYEVPRGYGELNTPAEENARKEVEEETGGTIEKLVNLGEFYNNTGFEGGAVSLFYAKLSSIGQPNEDEGIESFVWLTVKELEEWIANEKITDGFTIAAYTKAKLKGLI
ncbi:MAG: NUDIX hydrolase [Anaerolineales bacterium]|nr:MAG: NUDIX hydrolase [Anaerolineales bacterium]